MKKFIEKYSVSILTYAICIFLGCLVGILVMPRDWHFTEYGDEISLPDGMTFVRNKSTSRSTPSVNFTDGKVLYHSFCAHLMDDKNQLCHDDYAEISFTGRYVTFLEIEKYTRNGKQHIGGIILNGEFFSKDKYIRLITADKAVQTNILFIKYFDLVSRFLLFLSLAFTLAMSIYLMKNKRKEDG